jgi:hypothetical protein
MFNRKLAIFLIFVLNLCFLSACSDKQPVIDSKQKVSQGVEVIMKEGDRVRHQKFGDGVIIDKEGVGEHARVNVQFDSHGSKWLVIQYANLEKI